MKALLDEMAAVLDRLAEGESFDAIVEDTGITAKVSAARRELAESPNRDLLQASVDGQEKKSNGPSL